MLLKAGVHALIVCAFLNLINPVVTGPGFRVVLDAVSAGAFTIVSVSIAAGLLGLRAVAILVLLVAAIASYPLGTSELARLTMPVGIGVLLGRACRITITERTDAKERQ